MECIPRGPSNASIMIVGEAPGVDEERAGAPFVGQSGTELNAQLREAGIDIGDCFLTNVVRYRPPNNDIEAFIPTTKKDITPQHIFVRDRWVHPFVAEGLRKLEAEIEAVRPKAIIAFGNTALWALSGKTGITSWRGSMLTKGSALLMPTFHPAAVLRQWDWRPLAVNDLRRVAKALPTGAWPTVEWQFTVRPSFKGVCTFLSDCKNYKDLSVDIETRATHTACLAIATSKRRALCIPLMSTERPDGYWSFEEEFQIWLLLRELLRPGAHRIIGQNFSYDAQYFFWRHLIKPELGWDTMVVHHTMFPAMPKALHTQASLYCEQYVYWKDDGKEWDASVPEDQLWTYNCEDACRTFECFEEQLAALPCMGLVQQAEWQMESANNYFEVMLRGLRVSSESRALVRDDIVKAELELNEFVQAVLGHPINVKSPKQLQALFYEDFQLPVQKNRKTQRPSTDDAALTALTTKYPILTQLTNAILQLRSLGVLRSTFVEAELGLDGRIHCTYSVPGTATYRLSSSKDAFGSGGNLQNIPSEKSKSSAKAIKRGFTLPDMKKMFLADPGYTFFDADLDRADLQVVVWEADEELLKVLLHQGVDMHLFNAFTLASKEPPPLEELVETHSQYPEHRGRYKGQREFSKSFIHGTNYGGSARTMAINCGVTVKVAEQFQQRYFSRHPGIKRWHQRVAADLAATRTVQNKFGYRMRFLDRIESIFPEALAWVPQSTVGIVINRGVAVIERTLPEVQVLTQTHDSTGGQFPTARPELSDAVVKAMQVVIPYDDPLTIPVGIKTSEISWGHCG
jgi:DNA polymerase I-like protein with 3'-5' exonuclease and polymerase domains/uracil-DNA glycosylase